MKLLKMPIPTSGRDKLVINLLLTLAEAKRLPVQPQISQLGICHKFLLGCKLAQFFNASQVQHLTAFYYVSDHGAFYKDVETFQVG